MTIDLLLVILVLWVVIRGQGRAWIDTLFHYHPVNLDLNPLSAIGGGIGGAASAVGSGIRQVIPEAPKPADTETTTHIYVPGEGWIEVPKNP